MHPRVAIKVHAGENDPDTSMEKPMSVVQRELTPNPIVKKTPISMSLSAGLETEEICACIKLKTGKAKNPASTRFSIKGYPKDL